jgi:hypothetical protein
MAARPNFTDVELDGNNVRVFGVSAEEDLGDLVAIQVFVSQAPAAEGESARIASGVVAQKVSPWSAEFEKGDLGEGPAIAIGIETHSTPFSAITWAQPVEIEEK